MPIRSSNITLTSQKKLRINSFKNNSFINHNNHSQLTYFFYRGVEMGLGAVKVQGKKFNVENVYNQLRLNIYNTEMTEVSEIKGLEKLKKINSLDLSNNKLTNLSGIEAVPQITQIFLNNNELREIKALESMKNLDRIFLTSAFILWDSFRRHLAEKKNHIFQLSINRLDCFL